MKFIRKLRRRLSVYFLKSSWRKEDDGNQKVADRYFAISLWLAPSDNVSKDFLENLRIRTTHITENIDWYLEEQLSNGLLLFYYPMFFFKSLKRNIFRLFSLFKEEMICTINISMISHSIILNGKIL